MPFYRVTAEWARWNNEQACYVDGQVEAADAVDAAKQADALLREVWDRPPTSLSVTLG